ncbi:MAG: abscisic acid-deficient protein Aba4 family protein, partial [Pseudomonadota bacterium]
HYLAFDLFVGLWIARDADAKSISRLVQAPILLATLMAVRKGARISPRLPVCARYFRAMSAW